MKRGSEKKIRFFLEQLLKFNAFRTECLKRGESFDQYLSDEEESSADQFEQFLERLEESFLLAKPNIEMLDPDLVRKIEKWICCYGTLELVEKSKICRKTHEELKGSLRYHLGELPKSTLNTAEMREYLLDFFGEFKTVEAVEAVKAVKAVKAVDLAKIKRIRQQEFPF